MFSNEDQWSGMYDFGDDTPTCNYRCGSPMRLWFINADGHCEKWKEQSAQLVQEIWYCPANDYWLLECGHEPREDSIAEYNRCRDQAIDRVGPKIMNIISRAARNLMLITTLFVDGPLNEVPDVMKAIAAHINDPLFYFLKSV